VLQQFVNEFIVIVVVVVIVVIVINIIVIIIIVTVIIIIIIIIIIRDDVLSSIDRRQNVFVHNKMRERFAYVPKCRKTKLRFINLTSYTH
jgi:Flp pilus assembly protein TadB